MDRCRICLIKLSNDRKGIYKNMAGSVEMLYEACPSCHGRIVTDSREFGNPEWPKNQIVLEQRFHGKTKVKKTAKAKPKAKPKKKK